MDTVKLGDWKIKQKVSLSLYYNNQNLVVSSFHCFK